MKALTGYPRGMGRAKPAGRVATLYRFYDADENLLYIGVTQRGPARFKEHASSKRWWGQAAIATLEHFASGEDAYIAEAHAIHAERPRYNVVSDRRGAKPTRADLPLPPTARRPRRKPRRSFRHDETGQGQLQFPTE